MVGEGNLAGASRLATTPGVLKPSAAGSQIKHLGQGSEGLATLVAHPEHGVAVRKLYDPRGISGPEMIARKEQAGRALGDNPNFAKFLGSSSTPSGGQMHFNEFVQSGQAPTGQAGAQSIRHTQVQAQKGLSQAGFAGGKDIREGNMIFDKNTGSHKVIDYIPAQKGEFMRMPDRMSNVIAQSPTSTSSPWNANYQPGGGSRGGMLGRLLGGKNSPGGIRGTNAPALGTERTMPSIATDRTMAIGSPAPKPAGATTPMQSASAMTEPLKPQLPATAPLKPTKPAAPATTPMKPPKPVTGLAPAQP
jgi:hypothetical protein